MSLLWIWNGIDNHKTQDRIEYIKNSVQSKTSMIRFNWIENSTFPFCYLNILILEGILKNQNDSISIIH